MFNHTFKITLLLLGLVLLLVIIFVAIQPAPVLAQGSVPNTPSNLRIVSVTESSITIGWDDNSNNEQGFNIYKWNGADFPLFASVGVNVTTFTHTGLDCETSDFYMVSAYNSNGESSQIGWIEGRTTACLPAIPANVQASKRIYPDKVKVTWGSSLWATSYEVWRHTSNTSASATRIASSVSTTRFDDTTAVAGTTYYYWVKAKNLAGTSGFSSSDSGYRRPPGAPENPRWKILVLIYGSTDFSYTDSANQSHHLIAQMTTAEKERIAAAATQFVYEDIPELTSGNLYPSLTIRYPTRPLTTLIPLSCNDYSPSPTDTEAERDPTFDSVIVIWDGSGTDVNTGQPLSITGCAYGWGMGTGQLYSVIHADFIGPFTRDRNVFKHEWGHSILFYFEAAGTAPQPTVDNHINNTNTRYVHCPSGEPYILVDETDDNPIPNSIYNNNVGFTHDYYSGTTATPDQPTRCLGITAAAWAAGGPVTKPGEGPASIWVYLPIVERN